MSEQATETGPLTVDAAIASLTQPEPVEQEAAAAPVEAAETEEIEAEASPAEETEAEAETPGEEEEAAEETEAVEPLDPPLYWSQDAKAKFAELPPELQAVVLAQEGPREAATAKAKAEAAEKTKAADADLGKVQQLAQGLAERLPQWIATFEANWGTQTPDWIAYAAENGAEAMTLAKTQFEADRQKLQEAEAQTVHAQALAHEAFVKTEFAKLADIAPELAHPETGAAKRTEVTQYLVKQGIAPEAIIHISASEMSMARKAMLWDQAQVAIAARPKPKPALPAASSPVRPAAAVAQSPAQRTSAQVANRFAQTKSVDDAVAVLLASKG